MQRFAPAAAPRRRSLVLVASGLELDGGGRAVVGRLLTTHAARWAGERGVGLEVLHLGARHPLGESLPIVDFAGAQGALARAVWRRQLGTPRPALLFDLLGPARAQAWWPGPLRGPYAVMLLGVEVFGRLRGSRRRALGGAATRLAISEHTRAQVQRELPHAEFDVLPLALEERPPQGTVERRVLDEAGKGFFLIVGRMSAKERYKGHDELLAAMPELLAARPEARLVITGDGDDRARLEAVTAERGLGEQVTFTGFVSEATLAELYRRAAALVMPSRGEGFGLVYLEAMRAGKPCVAARGGAAEEIVVHGETGFLVDPADRRELAETLARLLAEPERARRLGEAGRRRYAEQFSPERFRERLEGHLDRLTEIA